MNKFRALISLMTAFLISSCASAPQTQALLQDPGSLPVSHDITDVPFVPQSENHCGPAALSMVARHAGMDFPLETLGLMMFTPGKEGTLQADFLGAGRRLGLMMVSVFSLRNLLVEVSHHHPVVVMENLGSLKNPIWHYAVLHGYDLTKQELVFHSGQDQNFKMSLSSFERVWRGADHWAVVTLKAGILPETSTLSENLNAAVSLERVGKNREANATYRSISQKWPDSSAAFFGLGNTFFNLKEYSSSAIAFEKAAKLEPESPAIWNNLGEVYLKLGQKLRANKAFQIRKKLATLRKL